MKILKYKKITSSSYKIFFDNHTNIIVHEDIILKYNLLVNKEVCDNVLKEIEKENVNYMAYDIALKYIEIKMRCESEIRKYLEKKEITHKVIESVIERLKQEGYLNKHTYIKAYIYDKVNLNNVGPNKIKKELLSLGFDLNEIDDEINNIDEELLLHKLDKMITKKISQCKNYNGNVLKQKIISYFLDKGYNLHLINSVLDKKNLNSNEKLKKEYNKLYSKYSKRYNGKELEYVIMNKLYQKGFSVEDIKKETL